MPAWLAKAATCARLSTGDRLKRAILARALLALAAIATPLQTHLAECRWSVHAIWPSHEFVDTMRVRADPLAHETPVQLVFPPVKIAVGFQNRQGVLP